MENKRDLEPQPTNSQVSKKRFGLTGILVPAFQFGTTLAVTFWSLFVFSFDSDPYPALFGLFVKYLLLLINLSL